MLNYTMTKCPIRIEFLDTDFWLFDYHGNETGAPLCVKNVQIYVLSLPFWYPKNYCGTDAPLLRVHFSNIKHPLCYWSIIHVCFCSSFYEYFVQKNL